MWISLNSTKNNIKLCCANYIKKKLVLNVVNLIISIIV